MPYKAMAAIMDITEGIRPGVPYIALNETACGNGVMRGADMIGITAKVLRAYLPVAPKNCAVGSAKHLHTVRVKPEDRIQHRRGTTEIILQRRRIWVERAEDQAMDRLDLRGA